MQEEKVTTESILSWIKEAIENKLPIGAGTWLDAASKLNVLLEDLDEDLINAKMHVAEARTLLLQEGKTASMAKMLMEGTEAYKSLLTLQARRERVCEFIRIAKKRVELKTWEA